VTDGRAKAIRTTRCVSWAKSRQIVDADRRQVLSLQGQSTSNPAEDAQIIELQRMCRAVQQCVTQLAHRLPAIRVPQRYVT